MEFVWIHHLQFFQIMEYQKINIQHGWDDGIYHLQISTKLKQHPWHGIDIH